ncbi:MAG: SDR family oxidoreductase [Gammaproteobacteria bacterium]|jgi:nucleoside-diphosphate-sugar epimerase|nr:SDR family oxidoreductase [Gammaproteobacteria bacterium]MBT3858337.1 SDR family oxidoreductase [Gammaproteobacteria bacterium]MBT3988540.1 SDR family oxidoreductase [Gammaproteobacteria bacterium]MBT4257302.1 SDR family oxidoreductase [Gammaproteobacteria bacterium]MBT4582189.1 SDR family oxidoreductase [Gammaproteobacteria bacterium]
MTRVLYIGGSGEISFACVEAAVVAGHHVTVFNRGTPRETFPTEVEQIVGDLNDDKTYAKLASREFDSVCQFIGLNTETIARDIDLFSGHCGQYTFISSASAYQKPWSGGVITEDTPLKNPFWEYSRLKAECEQMLFEAHSNGLLPVTVVRPSHTYRRRLPGTSFPGDHMAWRILNDKPIIVHDDGESLWTLTHADDFSRAFVALCGNPRALGEAFHITCDTAHSWNEIVEQVSTALDHPIKSVHVPSDKLIEYSEFWRGPLKGDKANSVVFDNSKVREAVAGWKCEISLPEGLASAAAYTRRLMEQGYTPDERLESLIDRVLAEQ